MVTRLTYDEHFCDVWKYPQKKRSDLVVSRGRGWWEELLEGGQKV